MRGSKNGAIVGITLIRISPDSGLPLACTRSDNSSASRKTRCALATIWSPSGVNRVERRVRSTSVTSSAFSRSRRPADSVDCDTEQASAARPKCPCSCSATRYCNWRKVGRWIVMGRRYSTRTLSASATPASFDKLRTNERSDISFPFAVSLSNHARAMSAATPADLRAVRP